MDYESGDQLTADLGCVWLFGHKSKSVGADLAFRRIDCALALSVTYSACGAI